jgi:hypothetical protein
MKAVPAGLPIFIVIYFVAGLYMAQWFRILRL